MEQLFPKEVVFWISEAIAEGGIIALIRFYCDWLSSPSGSTQLVSLYRMRSQNIRGCADESHEIGIASSLITHIVIYFAKIGNIGVKNYPDFYFLSKNHYLKEKIRYDFNCNLQSAPYQLQTQQNCESTNVRYTTLVQASKNELFLGVLGERMAGVTDQIRRYSCPVL